MTSRGEFEDIIGTRFPFLENDETALARFRPSMRLLIAEVLLNGLILLAQGAVPVALIVYGRATDQIVVERVGFLLLGPFVGLGLFIALGRLVNTGLEIYFTEYVITDRRAYSVTAVVSRKLSAVPYDKVTTLGLRQGVFERLIRTSRVVLDAYGQKGTRIQMRGVEDPMSVFGRLQALTRAETSAEALLRSD